MQALKRQNEDLRKTVEFFLSEIENQKELNAHHQDQIQTLLKFNERLLSIIQNEVHNKKDTCSLQPISQRSQRQSDLVGQAHNSFLKSNKIVAKSERGAENNFSLVERMKNTNSKLIDIFKERQRLRSQEDKSNEEEGFSDHIQYQTARVDFSSVNKAKHLQPILRVEELTKKLQQSKLVKQQMRQEIADFKKFRKQGLDFYNKKIKQIKGLSSKLNSFKPSEQLTQITRKLALSKTTSELISKVVLRGERKK